MKRSFGEFECPKCGSNYFGTSGVHNMDTVIGHCHGPLLNGLRCDFSWSRKNEDVNVFKHKPELTDEN
ncbi:hypothetical protein SIPHO054v2_p0040 [Vibrio phage 103E44.1]|nr:hypothetical protein SIPHO054v2_p0040 [Vibrio phage 103E44.1]QZI87894.1 hypothetical protein SIPHO055v2_p0039 [Vibrio phage 104E43.1]